MNSQLTLKLIHIFHEHPQEKNHIISVRVALQIKEKMTPPELSLVVSGVQPILQGLISFATQEIDLAWGVKGELRKLQTTLTTIQSVLQDAENQQVEKEAVKHWLRRLKSVAYDADDVVDEFNYEALRRKLEIQNQMMGKL
ncbi:putative disease resistance protein RGA4 isoform X2 [Macadamia integrifolia]|uniref:putative disease resistance protein RGA4 isoform X2 n=1 Tax=Macadamia integrifolia TaxID=60698 RepID=UPI001C4F37E8|nr:putative disease resistance protein RGA4 isoform X2 [Macadamia integrifolia]